MCLAVLFSNTGSSSNNLLKGSHALNRLVENNQLRHLAVSSGRKKFRSCCNDWIRLGYRDEIIKFGLAINIRTCNSHAIVRVLLNHVRIAVDKGNPHAFCMVFGSTENDSFLHPVGTFQIFRDFSCNLVNTVLENNVVVVVPVIVNAVFNHIAVNVGLSVVRSPSISNVGRDIDDLERSKEAVLYTLLQTVNVNRFSKVIYVRHLFTFLWSSGHTNLSGRRKVFQNLAPVAVFLSTSTVTLVYHDKVKVFRRNLPEMLLVILSHHLMIEGKIHFMGCNFFQTFFVRKINLVSCLFKRCEVLCNTLVYKNISVR